MIKKASTPEILTQAGIRPSIQRIAVTDYVLSHHTHPTVDEIYRDLAPEYPTLSRTTVYNTLKRLVEAKVIAQIDIESGNTRFDGTTTPHAHFMCTECGNILDIRLTEPLKMPADLLVTYTQVLTYGYCADCATKMKTDVQL